MSTIAKPPKSSQVFSPSQKTSSEHLANGKQTSPKQRLPASGTGLI